MDKLQNVKMILEVGGVINSASARCMRLKLMETNREYFIPKLFNIIVIVQSSHHPSSLFSIHITNIKYITSTKSLFSVNLITANFY